MFPSIRIHRSLVFASTAAGFALILPSCTSPQATTTVKQSRYIAGPSATRHRFVSTADPDSKLIAETTQENFFTWLFSLNESTPTKKKPAKASVPNIPASKIHSAVLARSTRGNTRIIVDVGRQKAFLLVGDDIAIEAPVSTARPGKYTPRGSFHVSERVRTGKVSTIYGVGMPYWMRLSGTVFGVHAGYLPGYPASAGCVRLPYSVAPVIFDATKSGTKVKIVDSWDLATNLWADEDAAKTMMASVDLPAVSPVP